MKKPLVILLVEDNIHNLFLFSTALREAGHQVIEAQSGEKALLLGSLHAPDLILLDIGLPGMSGQGVAVELREHPGLSRCPIIAVTAQHLELADMRAVGIDHIIHKPILPRDLAREVQEWYDSRSPAP
jgi:CheY-like chemotaxis protein